MFLSVPTFLHLLLGISSKYPLIIYQNIKKQVANIHILHESYLTFNQNL